LHWDTPVVFLKHLNCGIALRYTSCVSEAFELWHCIEIYQLCF
jgi:hypothetical protein